ncbi:Asp-tRNA(Asn)/Glu-tRNA(Gln) amidotransferase subunit GatC [Candidatus Woesearchaeota archaeon]|nr:Asp-tRNA(Asn)/Glu-tRNA(Gln) amidotransferase subunit GatC [Candidatus Woesearchaeota archaeon]
MKVDKELIRNVAELARLKLTDEEEKKFIEDLKEILGAFSAIDKVDTKGIEGAFHSVEIKDRLRDDLVEESLSQEEALENTEHKKDGYFKGPKAV